jgi:hypothetical protein
MTQNITFIPRNEIAKEYYPIPATKLIPDWYKNTQSYINGKKQPIGDGTTASTIKKCIPVFDSITAGYLILLPADVFVSQKDNAPHYEWAGYGLIEFHPLLQAPEHPAKNEFSYPKFLNQWGIKTPKGYSTLFVQPFHRDAPFTILPGIVDTDSYFSQVHFPFTLNNPKFEGLIPAGTPIAQVIPFKRNEWKMEIGEEQDIADAKHVSIKLNSKFFDRYKSMFWDRKEYK